ncbi:MAG: hypothetical protein ACYCPO_09225 [Acidobacteriaceae bacterium]
MEIPKETLGLAGEYAVASELCKRGIYAQLTLGNRKSVDLLLDVADVADGGMLRVQVKSKQGNEWPACRAFAREKAEVLVLVDFHMKADGQRPDFFILNGDDWKNVIEKTGFIPKGWGTMRDGIFEYTDGFKGLNVDREMVQEYAEQWDKISDMLSPKSAAHSS